MAAGQGPRLAGIEDIDYPNCIASWWGEVHAAVHKGLGQVGAITNGVMRDLDVMDAGFRFWLDRLVQAMDLFMWLKSGGL